MVALVRVRFSFYVVLLQRDMAISCTSFLIFILVSVSDLQLIDHGFDLQPFHFDNNDCGQVVHTHSPLSPNGVIWCWPRMVNFCS